MIHGPHQTNFQDHDHGSYEFTWLGSCSWIMILWSISPQVFGLWLADRGVWYHDNIFWYEATPNKKWLLSSLICLVFNIKYYIIIYIMNNTKLTNTTYLKYSSSPNTWTLFLIYIKILKYKDWIMADHENVPDHDHGSWQWIMVQITDFRSWPWSRSWSFGSWSYEFLPVGRTLFLKGS